LNAYLWLEYRAKTSKTEGYGYYFDRAIPWPEHPEYGAFHTAKYPVYLTI
jgi:para-nitrobenzyl esterase